MPLTSYWLVFIGVVSGTLLSQAIFSMLAMAHCQEEDQDRLEVELRGENFPYHLEPADNLINLGTPSTARLSNR